MSQDTDRTTLFANPRETGDLKWKGFIKGPICMDWFSEAGKLGKGKAATQVGLLIWLKYGFQKGGDPEPFGFTRELARKLSLSRNGCREGLKLLEKAGLVKVERPSKKSPIVTLVLIH